MKKNMVPLLAIAFVVAIVSTGLFYGLFASKLSNSSSNLPKQNVVVAARKLPRGAVLVASDVQVAEIRGSTAFSNAFTKPEQVIGSTLLDAIDANQALTKSGLVSANTPDGTVPPGMRAITIHVLESGGVLALLHPGSRVDIQAVSDRTSAPGESHTVLRTIFQNVEVLSTSAQTEQVALRFPAPPVTVLLRAEDSDALAVADTGARLRLTLRNRLDEAGSDRAAVVWPPGTATRAAGAPPARHAGTAKPAEALLLLARVVAVTEKGAQEISSSFSDPLDRNTLNVTRFRSQGDAESLLRQLESQHDLDIVSSSRLNFENGRAMAIAAGTGRRLSIAVHAQRQAGRVPVLRVEPFVSWSEGRGVATQSLTADLPMPFDTGFVISGIPQGRVGGVGRQLMVIVTPASLPVVALAARAPRT